MSEYMTIAGIVQFPPRERQAGGKQVRDVLIRAIGDNKNYSITVWPENGDITINKGDFLVADGKYSSSVGQNKEGAQVTYHNLSSNTIFRLDGSNTGSAAPTPAAAPAAAASGDDFPF
jgi:hypothetical protein